MNGQPDLAVSGRGVCKTFLRRTGEMVAALDHVDVDVQHGALTALIGPDGAGKTTLIRLIAGLLPPDGGELAVLGRDVAMQPQAVQDRIAYMPQRFGLYEDLTVKENLDLYADLHGVLAVERAERYPQLLDMTALGPFTGRLAGQLSGGMKQKLGLACTLVRRPALLLLDEPTVGVDPLSRRELWQIIQRLVRDDALTVLLSTSYLDEAEHCDQVVVLREGKVLSRGRPGEVTAIAQGRTFRADPRGTPVRSLQSRLLGDPAVADAVPEAGWVRVVRAGDGPLADGEILAGLPREAVPPRFEDGFMVLLHHHSTREQAAVTAVGNSLAQAALERKAPSKIVLRSSAGAGEPVIQVQDLVRRFGAFTAVNHIGFAVNRGEIFGLLGPNGAGKTTTFRMLCGLLSASSGTLRVAGLDLRTARAAARQHIGYVAQKFSLYGQLSVAENLEFFASAYGLYGDHRRDRIEWALRQFELKPLMQLPSGQLPGGYKQRLAMAVALLHDPEILFLDEPTSGADPMARREFWQRITLLAEQGVTVVVTTHFMEEAEYCDRVVILDAGRVLAEGTPAEVRRRAAPREGGVATMEDAFIAVVEAARERPQQAAPIAPAVGAADEPRGRPAAGLPSKQPPPARVSRGTSKLRRIAALVRKEARQLFRDPSSIAIGVAMPLLLILLFGFALSLDVTDVPVAVVLEDASPPATELAAAFELSPYFAARRLVSMPRAEDLLLAQRVDGIVRIRPDFARRLARGDGEVQVLVYGSDANRARIIQAYAQGAVGQWLVRRADRGSASTPDSAAADGVPSAGSAVLQQRLWFNEANESRYFLVPGLIVLIMTLIGALLTALVVAREWERGTLEALFVTPVRAGEILAAKMLPYFALGLIGLGLCILAARFLFHVPFRGSVLILNGVSMLYLLVALSIGLLISSVTKNQFVSSMVTLLVTFLPALFLSGFLFDLRSMPAAVRLLSYALPARYYVGILQTVFLTGDVWAVIVPGALVLGGMAAGLITLARLSATKRLA